MKRTLLAFTVAILLAGQLIFPVKAAPLPAGQNSGVCGSTYVVQYREYLSMIARKCGTTLADIIALNPQIFNPNIIYPGQVIRLDSSAPQISGYPYYQPNYQPNYQPYYQPYYYPNCPPCYCPNYPTYTPPSPSYGYAWASLSTTQARVGDSVTVYVSGFPANADIDFRIGKQGQVSSLVFDGKIGADGNTSLTFTVPSGANLGETWLVQVVTTEIQNGTQSSAVFYIIT